jgi:hypothetical protein
MKKIWMAVATTVLYANAMAASAGLLDDLKNKAVDAGKAMIPGSATPAEPPAPEPVEADNASPVEQLAREDISKATTIGKVTGGVIGGTTGNVVCNKNEDCRNNSAYRTVVLAASTAGGVVIGEAIGKQIGETAANRRRAYASEHEYLESEISASEKAIAVREKDIESNALEIERTRKRIAELEARQSLTQSEIDEAKNLKKQLKAETDRNNTLIVQYNEKIAYLDHALKTSEESAKAKQEDIELWQKKHGSLQEKRDTLLKQRDTVAQQNDQLDKDQKILDKVLT